jgi:hypothetical protein
VHSISVRLSQELVSCSQLLCKQKLKMKPKMKLKIFRYDLLVSCSQLSGKQKTETKTQNINNIKLKIFRYDLLVSCSQLLGKQGKHYTPPDDSIPEERLEGEWTALLQILDKKEQVLENELPVIQINP